MPIFIVKYKLYNNANFYRQNLSKMRSKLLCHLVTIPATLQHIDNLDLPNYQTLQH